MERIAEKMGSDSDDSGSDDQESEDKYLWEGKQIGKRVKRHPGEQVVEINSVEVDMHTLLSEQAEALLSEDLLSRRRESSRLQQLSYTTDPHHEGDSGESVNEKENK